MNDKEVYQLIGFLWLLFIAMFLIAVLMGCSDTVVGQKIETEADTTEYKITEQDWGFNDETS